jgi:hypothetical protein
MSSTTNPSDRITRLIDRFDHFVDAYDQHVPFTNSGQSEHHAATIRLRRRLGTVESALQSEEFVASMWNTLKTWGIGIRSTQLVDVEAFGSELWRWRIPLQALDGVPIQSARQSAKQDVWRLIQSLAIIENEARLVALTRTLHHLLPDLVVPIDRTYTRTFFGWPLQEFQTNQALVFSAAWDAFVKVARSVDPARLVGTGWRTSQTKVIDNAIVGFCLEEGLVEQRLTQAPEEPQGARRSNWTTVELRADLDSFERELRDTGLKEQTIQTYVARSKTFVDWLERKYVPKRPKS